MPAIPCPTFPTPWYTPTLLFFPGRLYLAGLGPGGLLPLPPNWRCVPAPAMPATPVTLPSPAPLCAVLIWGGGGGCALCLTPHPSPPQTSHPHLWFLPALPGPGSALPALPTPQSPCLLFYALALPMPHSTLCAAPFTLCLLWEEECPILPLYIPPQPSFPSHSSPWEFPFSPLCKPPFYHLTLPIYPFPVLVFVPCLCPFLPRTCQCLLHLPSPAFLTTDFYSYLGGREEEEGGTGGLISSPPVQAFPPTLSFPRKSPTLACLPPVIQCSAVCLPAYLPTPGDLFPFHYLL